MTSEGWEEEGLHSSVHTSAQLTGFLLQKERVTVRGRFKVTRGTCGKMVCAWGRAVQAQLPPALSGPAATAPSGPASGGQDAQLDEGLGGVGGPGCFCFVVDIFAEV